MAFFTLKDANGDVVSVASLRELQYWTALGYAIQGDAYGTAVAAFGGSDAYAPGPVNPASTGLTIPQIVAAVGSVSVVHGNTASTPRPATSSPVLWFGSVQPTAFADGDVYIPVSSA